MNSNLPVVKKESVFIKIKNWFKELFGMSEMLEEPMRGKMENNQKEIKRNNFIEEIKINGKNSILALQRKIENKEMEISNLTDEQLDEMIELYNKQIEEKKNELKYYREKITKG